MGRHRGAWSLQVWILVAGLMATLSGMAQAQSSQDDLAETIVGLGTPVAAMDVNDDGTLDGADVAKLGLTPISTPTPTATTTPTLTPTATTSPTPTPTATPSPTPSATPTPSPTGSPAAVVSAWLADGDPCKPNSYFVVRVGVRENPVEALPAAAFMRVYYPADSVEFVTASRAQFGTTTAGADTTGTLAGRPARYRDVSATALPANFQNWNPDVTPVAFEILFRTRTGSLPPGSIVVEDTPGLNALRDGSDRAIPHVYDNSQIDHPCDGPTPTPTPIPAAFASIAAQLGTGSPCTPNSDFSVRVSMPMNTTGLAPMVGYFRLYYPADKVTFLSTSSTYFCAFGPPIAEMRPGYPSHYRNIYVSLGSGNSAMTPILFNGNFRVRSDYQSSPLTFLVTDDPFVDVSLTSTTSVPVPHVIDDSAVEGLCGTASRPAP